MATVVNKAPGVYFEEFAPGAPIGGVGTSTPAFLGPAAAGPPAQPVPVTSWDGFRRAFGDEPPAASPYLWYAVRSFFVNGGAMCYVVRASTEVRPFLVLNDRGAGGGQPAFRLTARAFDPAHPISVTVTGDTAGVTTKLFRPTGTLGAPAAIGAMTLTLSAAADAVRFAPGDQVTVGTGGGAETVTVAAVNGTKLELALKLTKAFAAGAAVRLADLDVGDKVLRLEAGTGVATGTVLTLTQAAVTDTVRVARVVVERVSATDKTYRVTLAGAGLAKAFPLTADTAVVSRTFSIDVKQGGSVQATYAQLSTDPAHPRYYKAVINDDPRGLVTAAPADPPPTTAAPGDRPADLTDEPLAGGVADDPAAVGPPEYGAALQAIERLPDVNLVAAPGETRPQVQGDVLAHCERLANRFAVLDSRRGAPPLDPGGARDHRGELDSARGYAALYYPWLVVPAATGTDTVLVPPSGAMCGVMARTDDRRGVHKAPAGEEATVFGAVGLERAVTETEQGFLNEIGVNVLRVFKPGGRPVVWGGRTTATDANWRYVNVRRLFLFLEGSIEAGIRWAVFEPNNLQLWQKLRRSITDFLTRVWKDGALFGAKREDAFYVRIDEALNPFSEQQLGRLYIEIGVRPTYPAEFVVVRIGIWDGGSEVSEG